METKEMEGEQGIFRPFNSQIYKNAWRKVETGMNF